MNYLYPLALGLYAGLSSCASNASPHHDSPEALIARIQAPQPATEVVSWVQPGNQRVDCKLYVSVPKTSPGVVTQAAWDGQCKDGFAIGTGREVLTVDARSGSAIASYAGGQVRPSYFYQTHSAPMLVAFGDVQSGTLLLMREGEGDAGVASPLSLGTMVRGPDGITYVSLFNLAAGDTTYIKQFPSGYQVFYRYLADPLDPVAIEVFTRDGQAVVGYAIRQYKSGQVQQVDIGPDGARPVQVPDAYLAFLDTTLREIRQKSAAAQYGVAPAVATSTAYRAAVCGQPATPEVPSDLCKETTLLAAYAAQVIALDTAREQRFTEMRRTQQIDAPWQFAVRDYDANVTYPLNSLGDAVQQYVQSMGRARLMQRHLEQSAGNEVAAQGNGH